MYRLTKKLISFPPPEPPDQQPGGCNAMECARTGARRSLHATTERALCVHMIRQHRSRRRPVWWWPRPGEASSCTEGSSAASGATRPRTPGGTRARTAAAPSPSRPLRTPRGISSTARRRRRRHHLQPTPRPGTAPRACSLSSRRRGRSPMRLNLARSPQRATRSRSWWWRASASCRGRSGGRGTPSGGRGRRRRSRRGRRGAPRGAAPRGRAPRSCRRRRRRSATGAPTPGTTRPALPPCCATYSYAAEPKSKRSSRTHTSRIHVVSVCVVRRASAEQNLRRARVRFAARCDAALRG